MVSQRLQQQIDEYKGIYQQLKEALKWKVSDKRTLMMISSMYVTNPRTFNHERFLQIADYIKKEVGIFSTLKSGYRLLYLMCVLKIPKNSLINF